MEQKETTRSFEALLAERSAKVNEEVLRFLPEEEGMQKLILEACNYSVKNGGKRIRPLLMECAYFLCRLQQKGNAWENGAAEAAHAAAPLPDTIYEHCAEEYERLLAPFLAAIEMIHSSSLVHDDLPCMDNDRLRRGKPSTWAKYGEDMGTLAGDGLMIYAFETACRALSADQTDAADGRGEEAGRILAAVRILAQKTGVFGMIGGQTVDVALTGQTPDDETLSFIYRNKTGALIEAAVMIGAVLAGAEEGTVRTLETAASALGMAFQIQDDILDETATEETLGKPVGSDERNRKVTYAARRGLSEAAKDVARYTEQAEEKIRSIADYPFFTDLCRALIRRSH